jgi:FkbM family methyltransferase
MRATGFSKAVRLLVSAKGWLIGSVYRTGRHTRLGGTPRAGVSFENSLGGSQSVNELFRHEKRVLKQLVVKGYSPSVVYDIGASNGVWSDCIAEVLPKSEYHLFEPLSEVVEFYRSDLKDRLRRRANFHLHPIALGDRDGQATMFVARDEFGSSLRDRGDIPEVAARVEVPVRRLDEYAVEKRLPLPDVLKIDSQGAEDIILRGAGEFLSNAQVLFLECWLVRGYGPDTPLLGDIVSLLLSKGFSLVEFGERFYDDKHRLYSVDAFFFAESFLQKFQLGRD